jgi:hypothetical protein
VGRHNSFFKFLILFIILFFIGLPTFCLAETQEIFLDDISKTNNEFSFDVSNTKDIPITIKYGVIDNYGAVDVIFEPSIIELSGKETKQVKMIFSLDSNIVRNLKEEKQFDFLINANIASKKDGSVLLLNNDLGLPLNPETILFKFNYAPNTNFLDSIFYFIGDNYINILVIIIFLIFLGYFIYSLFQTFFIKKEIKSSIQNNVELQKTDKSTIRTNDKKDKQKSKTSFLNISIDKINSLIKFILNKSGKLLDKLKSIIFIIKKKDTSVKMKNNSSDKKIDEIYNDKKTEIGENKSSIINENSNLDKTEKCGLLDDDFKLGFKPNGKKLDFNYEDEITKFVEKNNGSWDVDSWFSFIEFIKLNCDIKSVHEIRLDVENYKNSYMNFKNGISDVVVKSDCSKEDGKKEEIKIKKIDEQLIDNSNDSNNDSSIKSDLNKMEEMLTKLKQIK